MINPTLLSDSLAAQMASEVIYSKLRTAAIDYLANEIMNGVSKELLDIPVTYIAELNRKLFFEKLFKSLESHEKKIGTMIMGIWEEERKIIISNLKKMKKTWLEKDVIDQILYPRKQFEVKIAKETKAIFEPLMEERGNEELRKIEAELRKPKKQTAAEVGIAFDVENPNVQSWLNAYTLYFSKNLEAVSISKLRTQLTEGMAAGEGIPELTKRVNLTYDNWNKVRSETIARSETIRASNRAALEAYKQSGVVKKKIWITHFGPLTCPHCEMMDGRTIDLEKNFWDLGETSIVQVEEEGKLTTHTMKFDYEAVETPPAHPRCRCAMSPWIKE